MTALDHASATTQMPVPLVLPDPPHSASWWVGGVRAWMVVPPVDAALLVAPAAWSPDQAQAHVVMAMLGLLLLTGGARYRARLHLSLLDELPALVGRLMTAVAIVATVIAVRHEQDVVAAFLIDAATAVGLVVLGRCVTGRLVATGRRRRITQHRTLLVGGGALAAEVAQILDAHPRYGLAVAGFVDDGRDCVAATATPQLGGLADLDRAVRYCAAEVLIVADGDFADRDLLDAVRTPAAGACDLLVVPRMHHFAMQTGPGDHIGSIPVYRVRTPNLRGPARMVKRAFDVAVAAPVLVLAAPLLGLLAFAVRLEGGPGVIFRQPRVGRDGVVFECLKLRSMRPASDAEPATTWSVATDHRIGLVGRFLWRTSLDELPQLCCWPPSRGPCWTTRG